MVVARDGDDTVKVQLAARFQEAIDEAAMQADAADADAYLAGWIRGEWTPAEGSTTQVAERISAELEELNTSDKLAQLIASSKE
ncbi:unannotated protein [freshwater metagenome]|uniref:Unannotated protein n=1 Tax=freshwater metagenome TaxID=449393 RepID=A0A6J5ZQV3_9ZZZZ